MNLVYKVLQVDTDYIVYYFKAGVSECDRKAMLDGLKCDESLLLYKRVNIPFEIPKSYIIEWKLRCDSGDCDTVKLLRDINPNWVFGGLTYDSGWLVYRGTKLCKFNVGSGVWSESGGMYKYTESEQVYIMREGYKRHRQDTEQLILVIDTKTGVCTKMGKIFGKGKMTIYKSMFKDETWNTEIVDSENIISVKRLRKEVC